MMRRIAMLITIVLMSTAMAQQSEEGLHETYGRTFAANNGFTLVTTGCPERAYCFEGMGDPAIGQMLWDMFMDWGYEEYPAIAGDRVSPWTPWVPWEHIRGGVSKVWQINDEFIAIAVYEDPDRPAMIVFILAGDS